MGNTLIGVIVGVFLGAFAVEVFRRKRPSAVRQLEARAARAADAVCTAFREGYAAPAELRSPPS